jgi:hypothetical protein
VQIRVRSPWGPLDVPARQDGDGWERCADLEEPAP